MLRERKFYFAGDTLVKLIHILSAEDKVIVKNYLTGLEYAMGYHAATLIFTPALRIGEVAKIFNCHPDTIRKWEDSGRVDKPRTWAVSGGFGHKSRFYSVKDLETLQEAARGIHHGRPRKDKLVKNNFPDMGTIKQSIRETLRRYNVNG